MFCKEPDRGVCEGEIIRLGPRRASLLERVSWHILLPTGRLCLLPNRKLVSRTGKTIICSSQIEQGGSATAGKEMTQNEPVRMGRQKLQFSSKPHHLRGGVQTVSRFFLWKRVGSWRDDLVNVRQASPLHNWIFHMCPVFSSVNGGICLFCVTTQSQTHFLRASFSKGQYIWGCSEWWRLSPHQTQIGYYWCQ